MRIRKLLNFSTHPGEPELFKDDWQHIMAFVHHNGFDGLELLPVGNYPFSRIPPQIVCGIHLRFFVFLRAFLQSRQEELETLFGTMENVNRFYGGSDPECIVKTYAAQLSLASDLGCDYVVYHPVQCDLAHIYNWNFPWHWQETLEICSEILNAALAESGYQGWLLFENLWWPGSFRLEYPGEYEYLRKRVHYERCGIALDTAHMLHSMHGFRQEKQAIARLLKKVESLGSLRQEIRTIHLCSALSGDYIKTSRRSVNQQPDLDFWQQLKLARKHVSRIDPHEPFTDPAIGALFDLVKPDQVVFEFTFPDTRTWQRKITTQKKILENILW